MSLQCLLMCLADTKLSPFVLLVFCCLFLFHAHCGWLQICEGQAEEAQVTEIRGQLAHARELIERYPGHEPLWCHLRFLLAYLLSQVLSPRSLTTHFFAPLPCAECPATLADEIGFAEDCEHDNTVERFEEQRHHALAFRLWLLDLVRQTTRKYADIAAGVEVAAAAAAAGRGSPLDQTDIVRKLAATVTSPALYGLALVQGWPPNKTTTSEQ